jgi:serine/threonine-protein kinase RsbT
MPGCHRVVDELAPRSPAPSDVDDGAREEELIAIRGEDDIVAARQRSRQLARELGFDLVDQARIATAVSELTRNVVRYATDGRGEVRLRRLAGSGVAGGTDGTGLEVVVADGGPGIDDVDRAMREGYTSGRGLGMGLSGTRRLMDEFEIASAPGRGTTVTIRKWRR